MRLTEASWYVLLKLVSPKRVITLPLVSVKTAPSSSKLQQDRRIAACSLRVDTALTPTFPQALNFLFKKKSPYVVQADLKFMAILLLQASIFL